MIIPAVAISQIYYLWQNMISNTTMRWLIKHNKNTMTPTPKLLALDEGYGAISLQEKLNINDHNYLL